MLHHVQQWHLPVLHLGPPMELQLPAHVGRLPHPISSSLSPPIQISMSRLLRPSWTDFGAALMGAGSVAFGSALLSAVAAQTQAKHVSTNSQRRYMITCVDMAVLIFNSPWIVQRRSISTYPYSFDRLWISSLAATAYDRTGTLEESYDRVIFNRVSSKYLLMPSKGQDLTLVALKHSLQLRPESSRQSVLLKLPPIIII